MMSAPLFLGKDSPTDGSKSVTTSIKFPSAKLFNAAGSNTTTSEPPSVRLIRTWSLVDDSFTTVTTPDGVPCESDASSFDTASLAILSDCTRMFPAAVPDTPSGSWTEFSSVLLLVVLLLKVVLEVLLLLELLLLVAVVTV